MAALLNCKWLASPADRTIPYIQVMQRPLASFLLIGGLGNTAGNSTRHMVLLHIVQATQLVGAGRPCFLGLPCPAPKPTSAEPLQQFADWPAQQPAAPRADLPVPLQESDIRQHPGGPSTASHAIGALGCLQRAGGVYSLRPQGESWLNQAA